MSYNTKPTFYLIVSDLDTRNPPTRVDLVADDLSSAQMQAELQGSIGNRIVVLYADMRLGVFVRPRAVESTSTPVQGTT